MRKHCSLNDLANLYSDSAVPASPVLVKRNSASAIPDSIRDKSMALSKDSSSLLPPPKSDAVDHKMVCSEFAAVNPFLAPTVSDGLPDPGFGQQLNRLQKPTNLFTPSQNLLCPSVSSLIDAHHLASWTRGDRLRSLSAIEALTSGRTVKGGFGVCNLKINGTRIPGSEANGTVVGGGKKTSLSSSFRLFGWEDPFSSKSEATKPSVISSLNTVRGKMIYIYIYTM